MGYVRGTKLIVPKLETPNNASGWTLPKKTMCSSLVNVSTKPRSSTMSCIKNLSRVAKNLWLSAFTTIQNLPKDGLLTDHMDLSSSMLLVIICKRDGMADMAATILTILTMVMTRTNNHPTDTILTMVMTRTNNHLTDTILPMVMTRTKNHPTEAIPTRSHTMTMKNLITRNQNLPRNHTNKNMNPILIRPLTIITKSLS